MKIIFADYYSTGTNHLFFNATAIEAVLSASNVEWVGLCGYRQHLNNIRTILEERELSPLHYFPQADPPSRKTSRAQQGRQTMCVYQQCLRTIAKENPDHVIFLAFEHTLWPIFVLGWLRPRIRKLTFDLTAFLHHPYRIRVGRFKPWLWHHLIDTTDFNRIVLSTCVKQSMDAFWGECNTLLWQHPSYTHLKPWNCSDERIIQRNDGVIRFFLAGRQAMLAARNGFLETFINACDIVSKNTNKQIEIYTTVTSTFSVANNPKMTITLLPQRLPNNDFTTMLKTCNYVVFTAEEDVEYRASGILMDSLTYGTPVFAPFAGHFRYIATATGSCASPGWFYKNFGEINTILQQVMACTPAAYSLMANAAMTYAQELSLTNQGAKLRTLLSI